MTLFELKEWGPKKLREIHKAFHRAILLRTPLESESIELDEREDGIRIHVRGSPGSSSSGGDSPAGGGGGTPVDMYGARGGGAAIFHLLQDRPPTGL